MKIKINQLEYITAVAKYGSISAASEKLYVSQPNISYAINCLEEELSLKIFERNTKGTTITESGYEVINRAKEILGNCEKLYDISNMNKKKISLKIGSRQYAPIVDAFMKFTNSCIAKEEYDIEFITAYGDELVKFILEHKIDIGFMLCEKNYVENLNDELSKLEIEFVPLGNLPIFIKLRKNHPCIEGHSINYDKLKEYPFVFTKSDEFEFSNFNKTNINKYINKSKKISVIDVDLKTNFLETTDAYSFGIHSTEKLLAEKNYIEIPIEDIKVTIGYAYNKATPVSDTIKLFLEILKINIPIPQINI
ncbi:LysR family transcriptional regulator [Haloimpatiens sp. FM7330]|uniref:LysR family transcriptional regulator n=1 Tax=Haloimpatiens sp. FM7330 TaxID=3298610 RepID=UPI00362B692F